jgi:predicted nuclease of restriction endonuclease-like (RecB) superfamily
MSASTQKVNLHGQVRELIIEAREAISKTVNFVTVVQNWEIGRMIVEEEQGGAAKAEYGKYIIKELSAKLSGEFGNGYSIQHLKFCRQFFNTYPIGYAVRSQTENAVRDARHSISAIEIVSLVIARNHPLFSIISPKLTWTHYRSLLSVENPKAREFYMYEAVANNWGTRALDRQISRLYYERLLSSNDRTAVEAEMREKTKDLQPEDVLRDPLILEFLQLKENKRYLETEIEQALIDKMNEFLLELGRGFAFVARQKRISTESKNFYIDLVFYNYLLKCFVLIDLKADELTHQDIGQMDMYMRIYEDQYKAPDDNPTIGLILCTKKDETVVKYSVLNEGKQLFAAKYKLYLPTEEELRQELEREKQLIELEIKLNKDK